MARMPAEERKEELIQIALRLFLERGHKNVTIADILKEVNGQNGMFYHHFKGKDEIVDAAIGRFIKDVSRSRMDIINEQSVPFAEKLKLICDKIQMDNATFTAMFGIPKIDMSFLIEAVDGFLNAMVKPMSEMFLSAKISGEIPGDSIVNEENAKAAARFILYGSNSLVRVRSEDGIENNDINMVYPFICAFLHIKPE